MRIDENVRRLIDAEMVRLGTSMNALAIKMKINQSTLYRIYSGRSANPRRENLAPIARYFECEIDDLFGDSSGLSPSRNMQDTKNLPSSDPVKSITDKQLDQAVAKIVEMAGMTLAEYVASRYVRSNDAHPSLEGRAGKVNRSSSDRRQKNDQQ